MDVDNLLGYGSGAVLETYHDSQATTSHHGWWMPPNDVLKAEALGGYGFIPSGFYMRIKGKKGSGITTGSLYLNLRWGKHST